MKPINNQHKSIYQTLASMVILGCFLLVTSCTTEDKPDRTVSGSTYTNSAVGLTLTFPSTWQIKTDQTYGSYKFDIVALAPPIDGFSPNLNVLFGAHSGPTAIADVLPLVHDQLVAAIPDLSAYSQATMNVDGKDVGRVEYETTVNGNPLHYRLLFFINHGKDITLTFTDRAGHFDSNADLDSIMASMHISN